MSFTSYFLVHLTCASLYSLLQKLGLYRILVDQEVWKFRVSVRVCVASFVIPSGFGW
jgi:hypothetical protein